jgi:flavin reductase (DIM6/NTAB) family NADH-FMN oxidoreductase RutF
MQIDPAKLSEREVYKILTGTVVPRPIAWVASISQDGRPNLAPFSYFNIACSDPPLLLFCPQRRGDGSPKDTLRNIEASGEFVLHIVSEELTPAMNQTSAEYPADIDEFSAAGLRSVPSLVVAPPRVADAVVAFECRVEQIVHVGNERGGDIVIGRVLLIHLRDDVYRDGHIMLNTLKPVARLAGNEYARIGDTFSLARPIYHPGDDHA